MPEPQVQGRNAQTSEAPPHGEFGVSEAARLLAQRRSELRQQQAPTEQAVETPGDEPETEIEVEGEEADALVETVGDEADDQQSPQEGEDQADETAEIDDENALLVLDGEEIPLKEVRQWREGAMRADDYQRKTQALAQSQQAIGQMENELTRFAHGMNRVYQGQIAAIQQRLQGFQGVDWEKLAEQNPQQYRAQRIKFEAARGRYESVQKEWQGFLGEYDQASQRAIALRAQAALPDIKQRIKGWNDGLYHDRRDFITKTYRGAEGSVVNKITDPWFWELANDAYTYRKGKQVTSKAAKVIRRTPKTNIGQGVGNVRQAQSKAQDETKLMQSMSKTTNSRTQEDAAVAILKQRREAARPRSQQRLR